MLEWLKVHVIDLATRVLSVASFRVYAKVDGKVVDAGIEFGPRKGGETSAWRKDGKKWRRDQQSECLPDGS